MKIQTTAEFVESDNIAQILGDLGIDYLQGFAIGHPQPVKKFVRNTSEISIPAPFPGSFQLAFRVFVAGLCHLQQVQAADTGDQYQYQPRGEMLCHVATGNGKNQYTFHQLEGAVFSRQAPIPGKVTSFRVS